MIGWGEYFPGDKKRQNVIHITPFAGHQSAPVPARTVSLTCQDFYHHFPRPRVQESRPNHGISNTIGLSAKSWKWQDSFGYWTNTVTYNCVCLVPEYSTRYSAWSPYLRKDRKCLERVQRKTSKLVKGFKSPSYEKSWPLWKNADCEEIWWRHAVNRKGKDRLQQSSSSGRFWLQHSRPPV